MYEAAESNEMAYLSLWAVLEKGLKIIEVVRKREELYEQVCAWKDYLDGQNNKQPSAIKSFSLQEPEKIPDVKVISGYMGGLPVVTEIMNTQSKNGSTKWRDRRNRIAHQAAPFGSNEKYEEFRDKICTGIDEMEKAIIDYET
ncbi:hypothetical protein GCM10010982_37950 [Bowmanella pacifica]|uniref:Uncharacterized protein n=1 Tax=Bowmanella pacifica TaxID=502051 RepID=A0A917Z478_9ALTE|nr:hypothetical protein GCM10010982_37950 [Bowmanella pacifica]